MSDFDSSLPVRTENDGDVVVKISDSATPSQQLKVEADGSINVNATSTNLDIRDLVFATDKVDVSGSEVSLDAATLAALEDITVSATDLDIRDLVFATDKVDVSGSEVSLDATTLAALESITVQNAAGAAAVNIQDGGNTITVDGTVELGATTLAALETITVDQGAPNTIDNAWTTSITDGTDSLGVNTDGSINVVVIDGTPGTPINDHYMAIALAAAATSNHDYTVPAGETFYLNQIEAAGSGKLKIEVYVNSVMKFVQFSSTANTNMSIHIDNPIVATAGQVVRVARVNKDMQAQDVYSTISGYLLP